MKRQNYRHKAKMTGRRLEILKLMATDLSFQEIAEKIGITITYLYFQNWRLYCYLGVNNRYDAVFVAIQQGLLTKNQLSRKVKRELYGKNNEKRK